MNIPLALREPLGLTRDPRETILRERLGAMLLDNGTMPDQEVPMANVICRMLYGSGFQWTMDILDLPPAKQAVWIREIVHGGGEGRLLTFYIAKDMGGGMSMMFPVLRLPGENTLHMKLEQFKEYTGDTAATLPAGITIVEPDKTTHYHVEEMADDAFANTFDEYADAEVSLTSLYWMRPGNQRMRYL